MSYKCNLVLPGFPKSGTSSLHVYLDMHHKISMSKNKEPHFFNKEDQFQEGAEFHNKLFKHSGCERVFGESSTTYCISKIACDRIFDALVRPKVILLLREPVERALSHYKWLCALGHESRSLSEALEVDGHDFDFAKSWGGNFKSYIQFSEYHKYVPMWQDRFGEENVLLLSSKELSEHPGESLRKVWTFLDVEPVELKQAITSNRTSDLKARRLPSWVFGVGRCLPASLRQHLGRSKETMNTLKALLGKDLANEPNYDDADIEYVKWLLQKDITFYKKTFFES